MAKQDSNPRMNLQQIWQMIRHWLRQMSQWFSGVWHQAGKNLKLVWHQVRQSSQRLIHQIRNRTHAADRKDSAGSEGPDPASDLSDTVRLAPVQPPMDGNLSQETVAVKSFKNKIPITSDPVREPVRPKALPIRRRSRQKVYRLKGYTTVAKINRKYQMESQQRFLRQLLLIIGIILTLILLFEMYNPIRDLSEWYRIIGISDLGDLSQTDTQITDSTTLPVDN